MYGKDHESTLEGLLRTYCGEGSLMEYTDDLTAWCSSRGLDAPEPDAPLRLAGAEGKAAVLGVLEVIPDDAVNSRVKALGVRWSLQDVQSNLADRLDSDKKKLAYIFLRELASGKPGLDDDLVADNWISQEMRAHGFFRE
jgi:hypothetical protein